MKRRTFLLMMAPAVLAGCGFHLRRVEGIPFARLHLTAPAGSAVAEQIRKALVSGGYVRLVDTPTQAEAVLKLGQESNSKTILSLSGAGRVTEYRLNYRVGYSVTAPDGRPWIESDTIELTRDFTYNDAAFLAKSSEEGLLYRDMQSQAAQQILRRLRNLKPQSVAAP